MEIEELVVAAQAGDAQAYEAIVERFQKMAVSYAFSKLGDFEEAQDVAQEAFLKAYADLLSLREPKAFPGWFKTIVQNQTVTIRRRNQVLLVPLEEGMTSAVGPDQHRALSRKDTARIVEEAIGALPEHEAEAVRLYYLDELPLTQVARRLQCTTSAVKVRLHSARTRLQQRLCRQTIRTQTLQTGSKIQEMATREAVQTIDRKLDALIDVTQKNMEEVFDLICAKARLMRFLGEMPQAVALIDEAVKMPMFRDNPQRHARFHLERGVCYLEKSEYDKAASDFDYCDHNLDKDSRWRIALDINLAVMGWRKGDLKICEKYNRRALQRATQTGLFRAQTSALNNLALVSWRWGHLAKAVEEFQQTLTLARKIKDRHSQAFLLMNLGSLKLEQGRFQEAKRLYEQARKRAEELEMRPVLGAIRNNQSNLALCQRQFDLALVHALAALELARQTFNRRGEVVAQENCATAFLYLGQAGNAREALDAGKKIASELGYRERLLAIELIHVEMLLHEQRFDLALEALSDSEKTLENIGCDVERPRLLRLRAEAQIGLGQMDDARRSIRKARQICAKQGNGNEDRSLQRLEKRLNK